MRPLFRPAFLDVLPIGTSHGENVTTNDFVSKGYNWRIEGNRSNPWSLLGTGSTYGDNFAGSVAPYDGYVIITLPVPIILTGIQFQMPGGNNQPLFAFEGLDRSSDPDGVWVALRDAYSMNIGPTAPSPFTAAFTNAVAVEALRIRSAVADTPSFTWYRGFYMDRILSLY